GRTCGHPSLRPRGRLFLGCDRSRLPGLELRQEPRRDDLALGRLRLYLLQDPLHDVRVLLEERRCVLAALTETLVAEAEVRARLRDDLPLERRVEHGTLPRDPLAVDDVELGLLERRGDLVLRHLHAHAVAVRLDAVLERLDAADVEPDRRVELERPAAGCGLR